MRAAMAACSLALLLATPLALAGSHSNTSTITINDADVATPYPSTIVVSGEGTTLTKVTVTLTNITHTFPDDFDVLLVGPTGLNAIIMSDACGQNPLGATNPITLTFDDAAAAAVPDTPACVSLTVRPANYVVGDFWPDPAPAPSGSVALSTFNTTNPNGTWELFIVDDEALDTGEVQGGWTLNITSSGPSAVAVRDFRALPLSRAVALRWRTGTEAGLLGFNVVRYSSGSTVRLNRALIAAKAPAGTSYRLVDRRVRAGVSYTYRLQVVKADGTRVWYGSSSLTVR